jgi:hypothetical protein
VIERGKEGFFSEEKEAKRLLFIGGVALATVYKVTRIEVFWFFFSKKNILASFRPSPHAPRG